MASRILRSVTSLVRTWPSTIFWRAVEKPDIGGPVKDEADVPRGNETSPSLIQALAKRNMAARAGHSRLSRAASARQTSLFASLFASLFDRHRESPDQPRDLIQMRGIVHKDGARQPDQALVVAEIGQRG